MAQWPQWNSGIYAQVAGYRCKPASLYQYYRKDGQKHLAAEALICKNERYPPPVENMWWTISKYIFIILLIVGISNIFIEFYYELLSNNMFFKDYKYYYVTDYREIQR